jgi:hypothetical protein
MAKAGSKFQPAGMVAIKTIDFAKIIPAMQNLLSVFKLSFS